MNLYMINPINNHYLAVALFLACIIKLGFTIVHHHTGDHGNSSERSMRKNYLHNKFKNLRN